MEGVVVTAHKDGSIVSTSVTTDAQGRYAFPENRLEPGHYNLAIRAVGYDIGAPAAADVVAEKTANADIKLDKTKNLASQLTNAEWMMSIPGTEDQKAMLLNCTSCHTLERVVRSTHDADEWTQVVSRMMGYGAVSQPIKPQPMLDRSRAGTPEQYRKMAEYLATINLSAVDKWQYDLKTLPRPTGRDTRAIVTEYDMGRKTTEPHDILVDKDGNVWYSDFGEMFIGKFDPKTLKLTEYPIKKFKDNAPTGLLEHRVRHHRQDLVRHHVPGLARRARSEDRRDQILSARRQVERRQGAAQLHRPAPRSRQQGVDQERRHPGDLPRRSENRRLGEIPPARPAARRTARRHLSGDGGLPEQSVDGRIHRRPSRQDRRQDRRR